MTVRGDGSRTIAGRLSNGKRRGNNYFKIDACVEVCFVVVQELHGVAIPQILNVALKYVHRNLKR